MENSFVIVGNRPWCKKLFLKLRKKTQYNFIFIQSQKKINFKYLKSIKAKYIFFLHWSSKIPNKIFNNFECIVFHMTDLPYGRGGSPLQNLIMMGKRNTKLTAFKCVKKLDSGPIYLKKKLSLDGNLEEIFSRVSILSEKMIFSIIRKKLKPRKQTGKVFNFKRRKPFHGNLKYARNINEVYNMIRMLDGQNYPKAFINFNNFILKFSCAKRNKLYFQAKVQKIKKI